MTPQETIKDLGIEIKSAFVPFSQSRNKGEKLKSLNWVVTVEHNGRPVLITDYMAGQGHCPSYKQGARTIDQTAAIDHECETGTKARQYHGMSHIAKGAVINPDPCDVLYSLIMDSSVLDAGGFEDWAADFGYDTDSRAAKSTYRACLDIALKMRAGIGEEKMRALQEAFEDY